ncbi:hypothetical protein B296_00055106 [Ensete ventricosum]|uniref:protein disulfide-isomerase n=1 Tax=Ensete ventricosum TaxID=4639 RepID=A0A426WZ98_ENSVE|nr:hypothetical protein B296_00055106 [Ensete ventricosum]
MAKDVEAGGRGEYAGKDYTDPPPEPLVDAEELTKWSLYRAAIAEFVATMLFLYVTVATVIGYKHQSDPAVNPTDAACSGAGILGIAWAFGGMIFILVYCTAGISGLLSLLLVSSFFPSSTIADVHRLRSAGGHINPAVTLGLFLARKISLVRALLYMIAQCLGAICGVGLVKGFQSAYYVRYGGGANELSDGYSKGTGLAAEIIGTFVLVYTVFSATDPKRNARDSHVPVVFMVHLATIPITGTGINPARSFGAAVIYNKDKAWDDQVQLSLDFMRICWMFWVGPFVGAAVAAAYHQYILRASGAKALGSRRMKRGGMTRQKRTYLRHRVSAVRHVSKSLRLLIFFLKAPPTPRVENPHMASRAFLLALTISSLLLVHAILASASTVPNDRGNPDLDAEDLSFLEEEVEGEKPPHTVDFYPEDDTTPVFDETDVVVLGDGNFSEFMGKHRHVMVEFYVPWCEHCKALAPEYAAAATALRGEDVVLAKVDATKANVLAQKYDLQGYPTVLFFGDGVHKDYPGQRNRDAIVAWIKKKIGLGVQNITTAEEAEKILTSESRLVLAFLDSLVGSDSQELSAASKLEDNINFYQTVNPDVAQLFHIDADAKRPSLVLLKKEADKISYYGKLNFPTI